MFYSFYFSLSIIFFTVFKISQCSEEKKTSCSSDYVMESGSFLDGYNEKIDEMRLHETPHLKNTVYLDYTGAGMYTKRQIEESSKVFLNGFYGNPHSNNPSSSLATELVEKTRKRILKMFGTSEKDFAVIFTSGATGALKLIGEAFPWEENKSVYAYTKINHNSVLGIRKIAISNGGKFVALGDESEVSKFKEEVKPKGLSLFAYPAQSNFAGRKYPLEWLELFKSDPNWYVLLDAAAYVPSNNLNLTEHPFDFVALSFYKVFGFPTGLGCVLIKKKNFDILRKIYFGGGAVNAVDPSCEKCNFKDLYEKYEDGTINFQAIISLNHGMKEFEEIGIEKISKHVNTLTRHLYVKLKELEYENGNKVVELYGNHVFNDYSRQGGIVSFNVKDRNGNFFDHNKIVSRAGKYNIHIRAGIHCNPGAASIDLLTNYEEQLASPACQMLDFTSEKPTGSARASVGWLTSYSDISIFLNWIKKEFILKETCESDPCLVLFPSEGKNCDVEELDEL